MHAAGLSPLAAAIAARAASSVSGSTTRSTRVGLICECRSLTMTPEGWAHAPAEGQAAVKPAILSNSLRSINPPQQLSRQIVFHDSDRLLTGNVSVLTL